MDPIALVCSVHREAEPVLARISAPSRLRGPVLDGWAGLLADREVIVLVAGMGKTNAARSLTALIERRRIAGVLCFGIAGAYAGSDLKIGDLALAEAEWYGDEGVETPNGWRSCEAIGIPLVEHRGVAHFNEMPVDRALVASAAAALTAAGRRFRSGAFGTVSTCSGTDARGALLAERHGALCETMEGAAIAHVAAIYDLPFIELRGVSNHVEDRDTTRWRAGEAAEAVADALPLVLPAFASDRAARSGTLSIPS